MLSTYSKHIYLRKFIIINNAHNISTVAHYALPHNPNQISALDFAANEASYLTIGSDRRWERDDYNQRRDNLCQREDALKCSNHL